MPENVDPEANFGITHRGSAASCVQLREVSVDLVSNLPGNVGPHVFINGEASDDIRLLETHSGRSETVRVAEFEAVVRLAANFLTHARRNDSSLVSINPFFETPRLARLFRTS